MRMSALFGRTLRDAPADAEVAGHRLLVRGGFVRSLGSGIYSCLPLAVRSLRKIEAILREEMDRIGGQEIEAPVVQPADLWKRSGRWRAVGAELTRFTDRADRDLVLAMTAEEAVAEITRSEVRSHRDLPRLLYQIGRKWRDDPRPRAGLIRVREFTMKDSYSLDATEEGLDGQYEAHRGAYLRVFRRCGLPVLEVQAETGMMGGSDSAEFMYLSEIGEDTVAICSGCGYAANRQIAGFRKEPLPTEAPRRLEKVATPGASTIDGLARFLGVLPTRTAKAVFLVGARRGSNTEEFVIAIVRGDMELSLSKVAAALGVGELRPATDEEIRAAGAVPGYGSSVGLPDVLVVADDLIPLSTNLVVGANEPDAHLTGANYGRDFTAAVVADIAAARAGDPCPECGVALQMRRGVEVGNIFKLGTRYSESLGCFYHDPGGAEKPVVMGSYGIGVGRLLACIAEEHHDEHGLRWPVSVAPYQVCLVNLAADPHPADRLYARLQGTGLEVLYDDRAERAGVKFNDADLIGTPLRVTVGDRSLVRGEAEVKRRDRAEGISVALDATADHLTKELEALRGGPG